MATQMTQEERTQYAEETVQAQRDSGMSVSAWCKENGISKPRFYRMKHALEGGDTDAAPADGDSNSNAGGNGNAAKKTVTRSGSNGNVTKTSVTAGSASSSVTVSCGTVTVTISGDVSAEVIANIIKAVL